MAADRGTMESEDKSWKMGERKLKMSVNMSVCVIEKEKQFIALRFIGFWVSEITVAVQVEQSNAGGEVSRSALVFSKISIANRNIHNSKEVMYAFPYLFPLSLVLASIVCMVESHHCSLLLLLYETMACSKVST